MNVFVTGGTGLLGRNLIPALLADGHDVVALVRSRQRARGLISGRVEFIEGDLTRPSSYAEQLNGVDAVTHAGACYGEFYRSSCMDGQLRGVNVQGTLSLLEASLGGGVRRFVYVSSAAVLQTKTGEATDASASVAVTGDNSYFDSKIAAEIAVRRFIAASPQMDVVTLLPTAMVGPNDTGPTPTGGMIKRLLSGEVNTVLPGALNLVDARDVALAAVAALTRGEHSERYLLGGARYSVREIFETAARTADRPPPTKSPPPSVLKLVLHFRRFVAALQKKTQHLRPSDIDRLQRDFWFDSTATTHALGVNFRPLEETLKDTVEWFLRNSDPTKR